MTTMAKGRDSGYYDERLQELDAEREELRTRRAEVRRELTNARRREARHAAAEAEREEREEAWRLWRWLRDHGTTVGSGEIAERVSLLSLLRAHIESHWHPTLDGTKMGRLGEPDRPVADDLLWARQLLEQLDTELIESDDTWEGESVLNVLEQIDLYGTYALFRLLDVEYPHPMIGDER